MISNLDKDDYTCIANDELSNNDIIFSTEGIPYTTRIEDDKYYKKPTIKTWVYKNITDTESQNDYWVDIDGIPMPAEYKDNLNKFNGEFRKGVYIITSYTIPLSNIKVLESMIPIVKGRLYNLPFETREAIAIKIRNRIKEHSSGRDFKFRTITFINKNLYETNEVIRLNKIVTSTNLEAMYDHDKLNAINNNITSSHEGVAESIYIGFEYHGKNNEQYNLNIDDMDFTMEINDTIDKNHLKVSIYKEDNDGNVSLCKSSKIYEEDLSNINFINRDKKDFANKVLEGERIRIEALMALRKYALDNDISLHKLLTQEGRTEASVLGIDKEQLSLAKEAAKMIGGII